MSLKGHDIALSNHLHIYPSALNNIHVMYILLRITDQQLKRLSAVLGRGVKKPDDLRLAGNPADCCAYFGRLMLVHSKFSKLYCITDY